jgi:RNA-directed DNA polymerase
MRTPDIEGVAIHGGPESYVGDPRGRSEALTGVRAGRLLSREITVSGCRRRLTRRKATSPAALARAARRTPRGLRTRACTESSCARTGRSHCSPVR